MRKTAAGPAAGRRDNTLGSTRSTYAAQETVTADEDQAAGEQAEKVAAQHSTAHRSLHSSTPPAGVLRPCGSHAINTRAAIAKPEAPTTWHTSNRRRKVQPVGHAQQLRDQIDDLRREKIMFQVG
jgi:hypothetical protein